MSSALSPQSSMGLTNGAEQHTPIPLSIRGSFPPWLDGSLYRTGPGTFSIPCDNGTTWEVHHWFDGPTMNHRFDIKDGGKEVWYSSRKGASGLEEKIAKLGKHPDPVTFAQPKDPCKSIFQKFFTTFRSLASSGQDSSIIDDDPSLSNVGVTLAPDLPGLVKSHRQPRDGHVIVARTDANEIQTLDPVTMVPLTTFTYRDLHEDLWGPLSASHGCNDPKTGAYFNFNLVLGKTPTYRIFRITEGYKGKPQTDVLATIQDAPAAYIHSMSMSNRWIIFCVWQADFSFNGASIAYYGNIAEAIKEWDPSRNALFYVIDKEKGGIVGKYKTKSFFSFHTLNAFEEGNDIFLDIAIYENHQFIFDLQLRNLKNHEQVHKIPLGNIARFRLPDVVNSNSSSSSDQKWKSGEIVKEHGKPGTQLDLPTFNPEFTGRRYRFAYGVSRSDSQFVTFTNQIVKHDLDGDEDSAMIWKCPNSTPGEPIFIPNPNGKDEDDGVLLTVVLDEEGRRSSLVVLDPKTMKETGRASMEEGKFVPLGFHGIFTDLV